MRGDAAWCLDKDFVEEVCLISFLSLALRSEPNRFLLINFFVTNLLGSDLSVEVRALGRHPHFLGSF